MSNKLVLKHKDSLVLKEKQKVNKQTTMRYRYLSLPCLTLSVFVVYWLIICPITFALYFFLSGTTRASPLESFIYWIIAFSVWFVIMCVVLIYWRRSQVQQNSEISIISKKYGSDSVERSFGDILQTSSKDAESPWTKIDSRDSSDQESKKGPLSLVIHKRASGEDIKDIAVVHAEQDEEARLNVASDYVAKSPLQDYLQLVTVSPSEDGEVKSPKTPMSPRELFFIDLIRGAEKAERTNSSKPRTYFFPSEETGSDAKDAETGEKVKEDTVDKKDAKDAVDLRGEDSGTSSEKSKHESSYFIADVEKSPISEKTEVFLHIDPDVGGDPTEVVVEKPVLLLRSNESNSQTNY